jgi:uncharacterized protein (TIGR02246 family)
MIRRVLTIALLGAVALQSQVCKAQVSQQGKSAAVSRAVDDLWARAEDGLKKGDVAALAALYSDDAMIVDPLSPTATGRAQIEANLKQMFASTKFLGMTHRRTGLEVSGNLAVENGTAEQTFQESGKAPQSVEFRYTLVFKNVNGKWLVLRDVSTPMPATSAAK